MLFDQRDLQCDEGITRSTCNTSKRWGEVAAEEQAYDAFEERFNECKIEGDETKT